MICSRFYYNGRDGDCHMYLTSTIGHDIFITINDTTKVEQLPCSNKELPSYAVRHICTYTLNNNGDIYPCKAGEHLQNCKDLDCNMMYKCPGYYCIPWRYVCDGKWDCSGAHDESDIHRCVAIRTCKSMFKC